MISFAERARRSIESRAKNAGRWVWIYALVDAETLEPFYVGQSRNVFTRFSAHNCATTNNGMRERRKTARFKPLLLLLRRVPPRHADTAEEWWIDEGKRRGWPLLNVVRARPERLLRPA